MTDFSPNNPLIEFAPDLWYHALKMTPEEIKQDEEKMIALYQRANAFCATHPKADRNILIQSWIMAEETPIQKVQFALLRAEAFKLAPKDAN